MKTLRLKLFNKACTFIHNYYQIVFVNKM